MIVICEECGRKYRISPEKIQGNVAKFKCKSCGHIITVEKSEEDSPAPAAFETGLERIETPAPKAPIAPAMAEAAAPSIESRKPATDYAADTAPSPAKKALGLRVKMTLLFFIVPIILIIAASLLYLWQLNQLSALIKGESTKIVSKLAEDGVASISRSVASQVKIFLQAHPALQPADFNDDLNFKRIAVQKVGMTGFTFLFQVPPEDQKEAGEWTVRTHVNPRIVGMDMGKNKQQLEISDPLWKIYTGAMGQRESRGFYKAKDPAGQMKDRFLICSPIEGTPYVTAATTDLEEFTRELKLLETRTEKRAQTTRNIVLVIFGATVVLIGIIVSVYGTMLVSRIRNLTDVAERISVGDLDAQVSSKTADEIGDLADAVGRMQDSIRISIERLRRRR